MNRILLTSLLTLVVCGTSFAEDAAKDKDNTAINKRDADQKTLTPEDQSNDPADLKITQAIRQAVVKDDALSMTAKNIKIITTGGAVTLRGPVKSEAEKTSIAKHAAAAVPPANITNQIEIEKE